MDMNMDGKTVIVAGLGVSGQSMMEVLGSRAGRVLGVDEKKPDADLHSFDQIDWDNTDMVMTSPVFNPRTPFILEAQKRNIPVMSEVELAWQLRVNSNTTGKPAQWIGITGTNGKTSTTEMTSEMLTACGLTAPAVGNIGKAVSHAAVDPANDVLCVELSSFQLHFTYSLELDCAAITNIADDHLDWHGGIENYAADKAKVFHNVKKALVYNADDERVTKLAFAAQTAPECRRIGFTLAEPKDGQIGVKDGWIVDMSGIAGGEAGKPFQVAKVTDFTHLTEPDGTVYPHLLADALTALALVLGLGADKDKALAALKQFTPGGHRIQTVAVAKTSDGGTIRFVDDSKATNAHAAKASLDSFADKSVVWIAGRTCQRKPFRTARRRPGAHHQGGHHHRQGPAANAGRVQGKRSRHSHVHHRSHGQRHRHGPRHRRCRHLRAIRRCGAHGSGLRVHGPVQVVRRSRKPVRAAGSALGE